MVEAELLEFLCDLLLKGKYDVTNKCPKNATANNTWGGGALFVVVCCHLTATEDANLLKCVTNTHACHFMDPQTAGNCHHLSQVCLVWFSPFCSVPHGSPVMVCPTLIGFTWGLLTRPSFHIKALLPQLLFDPRPASHFFYPVKM